MRIVLALVASVLGFAALLLGIMGEGASALGAIALAVGLLNTAALLRLNALEEDG